MRIKDAEVKMSRNMHSTALIKSGRARTAQLSPRGKPLTMSKEQLMGIMISAGPALDLLPKAPKGEAAGKKTSKC